MKKLTAQYMDKVLADMGSRRMVPVEEVPEFEGFPDYAKGLRIITEKVHENAMSRAGEVTRFVVASDLIDRLLDVRNAVSPPAHSIADLDARTEADDDEDPALGKSGAKTTATR